MTAVQPFKQTLSPSIPRWRIATVCDGESLLLQVDPHGDWLPLAIANLLPNPQGWAVTYFGEASDGWDVYLVR